MVLVVWPSWHRLPPVSSPGELAASAGLVHPPSLYQLALLAWLFPFSIEVISADDVSKGCVWWEQLGDRYCGDRIYKTRRIMVSSNEKRYLLYTRHCAKSFTGLIWSSQ